MAPARGEARPPVRVAFCYVPNGIIMSHWKPAAEGPLGELPEILAPLAALKDHISILTGLTHNNGRALGDGAGDHARAAASFLTGVHPRKTAGADIQLGVSADQVAAQQIGGRTRFASLELGCEDGRLVGNCDSGYSCAYSNSISWRSATTPNPPEINPRAVFERLFGSTDPRRLRYNKSILDFVREETARLKSTLGATDRHKLDEYLTSVREIEARIEQAEKDVGSFRPSFEQPAGVPVEYAGHASLMFDLMTAALQADATRILTFMLAREGSGRTYREIGVPDAHHPLTHHRGSEEMIAKVRRINRYHIELFAGWIRKLAATPEAGGSLLDNLMIVYGSGLSDGNRHHHHDLPVLLAGHVFKPGRHVAYPVETPMTNLFLTILERMGVKPEAIGDSNGRLEHLADV
jgi:hypothetical protein